MWLLKIRSCNVHNPRVISVTRKQLGTILKKRNRRQAIIFENNPFFFMFKEPGDGRGRPRATSQVFFIEQSMNLTVPIDSGRNSSCLLTPLNLSGYLWPRTICAYV